MSNHNGVLFDKEKRKNQKSDKNGTAALVAILFLFVALVVVLLILSREREEPVSVPNPQEIIQKNENSISIPGYELLTLRAGSELQTIELKNPEQNTCWFQVTLSLSDGTVLWKSDRFEPGKTSGRIRLQRVLTAGSYSKAVLHYDCFRMDESLTPLNGAEMKLTLIVK